MAVLVCTKILDVAFPSDTGDGVGRVCGRIRGEYLGNMEPHVQVAELTGAVAKGREGINPADITCSYRMVCAGTLHPDRAVTNRRTELIERVAINAVFGWALDDSREYRGVGAK